VLFGLAVGISGTHDARPPSTCVVSGCNSLANRTTFGDDLSVFGIFVMLDSLLVLATTVVLVVMTLAVELGLVIYRRHHPTVKADS